MADPDHNDEVAFPQLSPEDVQALAGLAEECSFRDGEVLFRAGQRGLPLYVVVAGGIAIVEESDGTPKTIVVHGPREFTGDVSLLTDRPALISAYARAHSRLLRPAGAVSSGHPGDPRSQRQAARRVPDTSVHAGALGPGRRAACSGLSATRI